jgi:hypothetical protein
MTLRCPHCGSDRPAIDDRVFRLACPACGGPRLPAQASFRDVAAEQVATRALFRARIRAWRVRARLRFGAFFAAMMTLFVALRMSHTHHVHLVPILMLGLVWTWLAISFTRRHRRSAWRVRGALDDAYALAGLGTQLAVPRVRVRVREEALQPTKQSEREAPPLEAPPLEDADDHVDALADFDRRLAAVRKNG